MKDWIEFREAMEVARKVTFRQALFAAFEKAQGDNLLYLKCAFPTEWEELQERKANSLGFADYDKPIRLWP
jgi:hypothetical protein